MSIYNRVVAADSTASLAPTVRTRLATEMADPASDVGASLSGTFVPLAGDAAISGTKSFDGDGKLEFNDGFTPNYDTVLWIASKQRLNPTLNSQGLYIQHRVGGDLGGFVNDAGASELRLTGATNTGAGQGAHEDSIVITGGVNAIGALHASLANFHTSGTPTGTISNLALFRATTAPALPAGLTVTQAASLSLQQQTIGATNYTIFAPDGNSSIGTLVAKDTSTPTLTLKLLSGSTKNLTQWTDASSDIKLRVTSAGDLLSVGGSILIRNSADSGTFFSLTTGGPRWNDAGLSQTTVGAAGGASAPPATPTRYFRVQDSTGTTLVIPAYALS